uniref:Uncharacterized protein n=1 Tax=Candidatus Kentrum sp. TC TaxID=2126339 RepID=A0A450YML1_9GAMM|nr:MAG: hypothetical protein BECKTC1821E_GA0114239_102123 [Candidatus Kentron sp. TC]
MSPCLDVFIAGGGDVSNMIVRKNQQGKKQANASVKEKPWGNRRVIRHTKTRDPSPCASANYPKTPRFESTLSPSKNRAALRRTFDARFRAGKAKLLR